MSFRGQTQALDFSMLPKVRTHAQLGTIAGEGCSLWNPFTYSTCINQIRNARTEMSHVLYRTHSLALSWSQLVNDIANWPESSVKSNALAEANTRLNEAWSLVRSAVAVQNKFEESVNPYRSIPGFDTIFLSGLKGLAAAPIVIAPAAVSYGWAIIVGGSLLATGLIAWGVTEAYAVVQQANAEEAHYNQFVQYYKTCQQLAAEGKPCNVAPPSTTPPKDGSMTAWILAGVLGFIMISALRR